MFNELNKNTITIKEGITLEELAFRPLKDFAGQTIRVDGYFFTNGKYGKQVVVVGNGYKINMPERAVKTFEKIHSDPQLIKGVLEGHLAIADVKLINTKNGMTASYQLKDC